MSHQFAVRIARLVAGTLLLVATGRLISVYSTILFEEFSRNAAQPEIYLSPWDDIARYSAITIASVPLALLCGIRLLRRAYKRIDGPPSLLSFASDCAGMCAVTSFIQFISIPVATRSDPLLDSVRYALTISLLKENLPIAALGGAVGAWSGLIVSRLVIGPDKRRQALGAIATLAILTCLCSTILIVRFAPHDDNLQFWMWLLSPLGSAFIGVATVRLRDRRVVPS
jgi:hypothetical protein